jgi:hypothetical protein
VQVAYVEVIVGWMQQCASKARADGWVGGFDIEEVAAASKIPPEQVAAVYRVLDNLGWLKGHTIVSWADDNPRDKTSTDRKRNQRDREKARAAVSAGTATPEQQELLSASELDALRRLAALSHVTASPQPAAPPEEPAALFVAQGDPTDGDRARVWLLGDGMTRGLSYGPASKIVADQLGQRRMSADSTIRRWLRDDMMNDALALALIISAAECEALPGDGFRNVVEQRMADYQRERLAGPKLPLGPAAIRGGRHGS